MINWILRKIDKAAGLYMDWRRGWLAMQDRAKGGDPAWNAGDFDINLMTDEETKRRNITMQWLGEHDGMALFAETCGELLIAHEAENYVEFDIHPQLHRGLKPVRITIQWANKESPAKQNARLRDELAKLRAELDECHGASAEDE
jgi:hypothetical protein